MRYRETPIHPFIQSIMDKYEVATLAELADKIGISHRQMYNLADGSTNNRTLEIHRKVAQGLGISLDRWVEGYLNNK